MKYTTTSSLFVTGMLALSLVGCSTNTEVTSNSTTTLTDVAQTSGQLASGSSFSISGSSSSTTGGSLTAPQGGGPGGGSHQGPGGRDGLLDGTSLLAPTDELLAIIDAESAGDFRGLRMHEMGGATVTNYDAAGNVISMPAPEQNSGGPEGCSFSGKQFPKFDSLLAKVARTVIDFGSGVTNARATTSVTRSGKIIITRTGDADTHTETIIFEGYKVNGASIEGTKTRVSTFDTSNGSGVSSTHVVNGKITFSDGTATTLTSSKERKSTIVLDSSNKPVSGQIVTDGSTVITSVDGTVIYSNTITKSLVEDVSCGRQRHAPVSGTVATVYRMDNVSIDFGNGSCSSTTVTVTLNGVVTTKSLG